MFDIYKSYYSQGLFTKADLDLFVQAQMLTADQEQQILTSVNQPA
ncbi:XkdX family protein [Limosilactobacillus fermentum]|nr:XkdX family protein [Limosilactobacillus fermentum]